MGSLQRPQGGSKAPAAVGIFLSNDVVLTLQLRAIAADGRQRQGMVDHLGAFRELKARKAGVVELAKAGRQDGRQGLADQGPGLPAVDLIKSGIGFDDVAAGIGAHKGQVLFLPEGSDSTWGPLRNHQGDQPVGFRVEARTKCYLK